MLNDSDIESLLTRYRPAGPPPELRGRIVRFAEPARESEPRVLRWWRYAAAAVVAASAGLQIAALALDHRTAQIVAFEATLPAEAQPIVELLGGDEAAERYVRLAMAVEARRNTTRPLTLEGL